jgi:chromosome segregation ATPase
MMTNNESGIVFDAKSGISEEEQREILAKINGIAEKNRLSISEGTEGKNKDLSFKAKKSGAGFPVIVNIIAFAALAGGMVLLSSMQGKTDAQIRTGAKVYSSVERALIEKIRMETQNEAAANATGELERLNRDYYQAAAIEDQIGAFFANLNRQITDNSLDEAGSTIKSMRIFINTPAFQSLRSIQARKRFYDQAVNSLETMVETTKKYQAALNSDNPNQNPFSDFQARIAQLEQSLAEKDKTIDALSSQGSGASRRLNELEKANSALQTENRQLGRTNNTLQTRNSQLTADLDRQTRSTASLQQSVNSLQQSVNSLQQSERDLQTENARLTQTVTARDNTISGNENTIRDLRRQNDSQTQRINRIQEVVQGKPALNMTIGELSESVSKIQELLGQ